MEIKRRKTLAQEVKEEIQRPISTKVMPKLISSGSTLLNLALSDTPDGGYALGKVVNIIGDSSAGKSFLLWTMFAEAVYSGEYNDYDIIYDDSERALEFDICKLFGKKAEDKVITEIRSDTIEDFHDNVIKSLGDKKKPRNIIYGLDSFDALTSDDEIERDIRKGSYRMEKPKMASEILRKIVGKIDDTNSLIIIVSQTRDNIGVTFGSKKTRSGGKALKFYCMHELWLAVESHIKRLEREVGVNVIAKVSKNKLTGKQRTVKFPIVYDYGVLDIESMVNWMIEEEFWKKEARIVNTKGDFENFSQSALIDHIYDNKLKNKLINIVTRHWNEIEEKIKTKRSPKYGG